MADVSLSARLTVSVLPKENLRLCCAAEFHQRCLLAALTWQELMKLMETDKRQRQEEIKSALPELLTVYNVLDTVSWTSAH